MLLYRPNAGMIETDNITGRDLGALKQNKEKHSLMGLLEYIRNVTIKLVIVDTTAVLALYIVFLLLE